LRDARRFEAAQRGRRIKKAGFDPFAIVTRFSQDNSAILKTIRKRGLSRER
jgi:hypothetical protein